jgi:hypothetical protein
MKSIGAITLILFTLIGSGTALAQTADVDWKLYGSATVGGQPSLCFYEAKGVIRRSSEPDHMRVWIKCLALKDADNIKLNESSARQAAEKIYGGYVPPIVVVGVMEFDQLIDIASYEEIANTGLVQPQASIFYELSCSERMLRELSISTRSKGRADKPGDWKYIPPEGNAATLLKILWRAS